MGLKVHGSTVAEASMKANGLSANTIAKVVYVSDNCNAYMGAKGKFLVKCLVGAVIYLDGGPAMIAETLLPLYEVVEMPKGFKLTLEQV